jgi:trimethylamine--corrinoid protein Co-methyltransferase
MEFALTMCCEKLVIDNEIVGMAMRAVAGIEVNDDTLAYDLIKEVGPGGNFVTARHTRQFMRQEHYQPTLSDRINREDWESAGGKVTWERAAEKVTKLLASHEYCLPDSLRSRIIKEIEGIVV